MVAFRSQNITLPFVIQNDFPTVVPSDIKWTFTDVHGNLIHNPIISGVNYVFSEDNLNLTIVNADNALEGLYTLVATNVAGSGSASTELVVEGLQFT